MELSKSEDQPLTEKIDNNSQNSRTQKKTKNSPQRRVQNSQNTENDCVCENETISNKSSDGTAAISMMGKCEGIRSSPRNISVGSTKVNISGSPVEQRRSEGSLLVDNISSNFVNIGLVRNEVSEHGTPNISRGSLSDNSPDLIQDVHMGDDNGDADSGYSGIE